MTTDNVTNLFPAGPSCWEGTPFMTFDYWADKADETPDFLIEGLIHNEATIVSGKPTVGKTRLVAAMAAAVARGDREFCGQRVNAHGNVLVITTDPGESGRWGLRMREHGVPADTVGITRYNADHWDRYLHAAKHARLLVFDNVLGSLGSGKVSDDDAARALTSELTKIQENGTTVILVAHSAKNFEAQSGSHTPTGAMGSTAYAAWERLNLHVHDVTEPNTRAIKIRSNDHADRSLLLAANWGRASAEWELLNSTEDTRQRTEETYAKRRDLFAQVVNDPELRTIRNQAEIGRRLYEADPNGFANGEAARQAFRKAMSAAGGRFESGKWQL
ncbi:AAA family ATPase [Rhodococcus sp. NPDC059968]|uniref:AAA family ATPase n=1 Tax=Rhodococcus sp. NPDC059968 TaxID=3347017 RepID=UPI0036720E33